MPLYHKIKSSTVSWFGTGGLINNYYTIETIQELQAFLSMKQSFYIIGATTNTLFLDHEFENVIKINLQKIQILTPSQIYVQAGVLTTKLMRFCIKHNIGGLEFTNSIPGTIGGLVKMNAGAYQKEMKDVVLKVEIMDKFGNLMWLEQHEMKYSYRFSALPPDHIIIGAILAVHESDPLHIQTLIDQHRVHRINTQPLNVRTLGSTFMNPNDAINPLLFPFKPSAGYLIEQVGLKGFAIEGARFSNKHANFIENFNHASAQNFLDLVLLAQQKVYEKYKVLLKQEVLFI